MGGIWWSTTLVAARNLCIHRLKAQTFFYSGAADGAWLVHLHLQEASSIEIQKVVVSTQELATA